MAQVQPSEMPAFLWSFAYFFCLLCGYYMIRPLRDALGIVGGVENLHWLFTSVFVVMLAVVPLYGWVTSRFSQRQFIHWIYFFFIANLLLFYGLLKIELNPVYVARAFFIWVSVYNLFVVSVFWSFMTDLYNNEQAKRLFPVIAMGGSVGAIVGPLLAVSLVSLVGTTHLLLISAGFLSFAALCVHQLSNGQQAKHKAASPELSASPQQSNIAMGGSIFESFKLIVVSPYLLAICLFTLLLTILATFLYFQQAELIRDAFVSLESRTAVFAMIDFFVNGLTLFLQFFVTGRLLKNAGLVWTLMLIPILLALGFVVLSINSSLAVVIVMQIVRRAGNYAIMRPAREVLYVALNRNEKYKAKNLIDTLVYRSGDLMGAWFFAGLQAIGLGLTGVALVSVPIAGIWIMIARFLGIQNNYLASPRSAVGKLHGAHSP